MNWEQSPLSSKHNSSFIVNYRYSTLGVLNTAGLNFGTGKSIPQYQDLTFKIQGQIGPKTHYSFFGLGGPSKINFLGKDADPKSLYGASEENLFTSYFTGIVGATLETRFNTNAFGKLSVGYSRTYENIEHDSIAVPSDVAYRNEEHQYTTNKISVNYNLSYKINSKNSLVIGTNNSLLYSDLYDRKIYFDSSGQKINLDVNNRLVLLQGYVEGKHRFSDAVSINLGVHTQFLTLNSSYSLEPRIGFRYLTPGHNIVALGYGSVAQMQSPLVYFYQTNSNGANYYTNEKLGFTKSQHLVGSYDYVITHNLHLKTELYYQKISNAPVETRPSSFSELNEGADFGDEKKDSLVNKGWGRNYGVEWTLEKYFTRGTYLLITASLFDSKYKGSDGVVHNTAFNSRYAFNILAGKDCKVGKQNTLSFNVKIGKVGGRYISPVDIASSQAEHTTVYDQSSAPYSLNLPPYFRADAKIGYRKNTMRSTIEFGIDLENFTFHDNILTQKYSVSAGRVVSQYEQGFLPVPYFRLTF